MPPSSSEPALDPQEEAAVELLDGELLTAVSPVVDATVVIEPARRSATTVAVQAAAVATTGFVAGAIATVVVARKVGVVRRRRGLGGLPPVVDSKRFLVDVHQLGGR